jgi:hypothetical protein
MKELLKLTKSVTTEKLYFSAQHYYREWAGCIAPSSLAT